MATATAIRMMTAQAQPTVMQNIRVDILTVVVASENTGQTSKPAPILFRTTKIYCQCLKIQDRHQQTNPTHVKRLLWCVEFVKKIKNCWFDQTLPTYLLRLIMTVSLSNKRHSLELTYFNPLKCILEFNEGHRKAWNILEE